MADLDEAHTARIATCLTDIEISDLNPDNQECSICHQSLIPSSEAGEISCTGPATRLVCGHIFGKACIMEWLVDNPTCPFCRFDMEPTVWRNERTAILNALQTTIQLHDNTHQAGRGARRLRDFILRVTKEEEMPCEPICIAIRHLSREPGFMTNEYLKKILEWWKRQVKSGEAPMRMLYEFPILVAALVDDIRIHIHTSPDDGAASRGRGRGIGLRSLLWWWVRP